MAWTEDSVSGVKRMYNLDLGTTLDANGTALTNATAAYSDAIKVGTHVDLGTISVTTEIDDASSGAIVVDLYACNTESGTYVKVADDVATAYGSGGNANGYTGGTVNLALYPYPFFKIALHSAADESSNHFRVIVSQADGAIGDMSIGGVGADPS